MWIAIAILVFTVALPSAASAQTSLQDLMKPYEAKSRPDYVPPAESKAPATAAPKPRFDTKPVPEGDPAEIAEMAIR